MNTAIGGRVATQSENRTKYVLKGYVCFKESSGLKNNVCFKRVRTLKGVWPQMCMYALKGKYALKENVCFKGICMPSRGMCVLKGMYALKEIYALKKNPCLKGVCMP